MNEDTVLLEQKIVDELQLDETKLREDLKNQPLRLFYWGRMWAKALRAKKEARINLDRIEGRLSTEYRLKMSQINPRQRPILQMVEAYLNEQEEYNSAREALIKAEYAENILAVAKEAFQQRHSMLEEMSKRV